MNEHAEVTTPARRTRVACKACHTRRVKCDAADGMPCMHCRTRQTLCELIESRRGKYPRQQSQKRRCRPDRWNDSGSAVDPVHHSGSPANSTAQVQQANETRRTQINSVLPVENTPEREMRNVLTLEGGRSTHLLNSLNLSSIIDMVRRVKEGNYENICSSTYGLASAVEKVTLQPSVHLHEQISLQEALDLPEERVSNQLIRFFFEYFHPAYPVIDRSLFASLYKQGQASPLLLHSIYMVALTCGPYNLVEISGHTDRTSAKKVHFLRAKRLYEAGHETDATNVAAALHLLSFWWTEPHEQDSWYWQGCAVTLAQSLGMHRALAGRGISPRLISIWKRIWWSIYTRDRHAAAALGRPCRIRDEDCDVESLNENDLSVDLATDDELIPTQQPHHISYFLDIAKLSVIIGNIVIGEFSPHPPPLEKYEPGFSLLRLQAWRDETCWPAATTLPDKSGGLFFWASMLDASFQNAYILLFRPKPTGSQILPEPERHTRAQMAADAITRIAEDLLSAELIQHAQLHLVPSLFSALSIYTLAIDKSNTVHRKLAENKSRQCILALSELVKIWPVGMWLKMAFVNLLRRLVSQRAITHPRSDLNSTGTDQIDPGGHPSSPNQAYSVSNGPVESGSAITTGSLPSTKPASNSAIHLLMSSQVDTNDGLAAPLDFAYESSWFGSSECIFDAEFLQEELRSFL